MLAAYSWKCIMLTKQPYYVDHSSMHMYYIDFTMQVFYVDH